MFAKQFYWYKLRRLLFKLRHPRAFQLSLCFLLGAYWLAGSRLPDGGGESHHFKGTRNPGPGRLPAPAPAAPQLKRLDTSWAILHLDRALRTRVPDCILILSVSSLGCRWVVTFELGWKDKNGNPLQCSCLENPRDWGAWWATVYGVAQSRVTEVT